MNRPAVSSTRSEKPRKEPSKKRLLTPQWKEPRPSLRGCQAPAESFCCLAGRQVTIPIANAWGCVFIVPNYRLLPQVEMDVLVRDAAAGMSDALRAAAPDIGVPSDPATKEIADFMAKALAK
jgi:hypothetical protein